MDKIIRFIFMLILSISSTSLLPAIYLIKSSYKIIKWEGLGSEYSLQLNTAIYLLVVGILSKISLWMIKHRAPDSINNDVKEISTVNNEYLPIYLGYIFVSLSIPTLADNQIDWVSLMVIYLLICLFVTFSKSLCFNPVFIIFGYSYYQVRTSGNIKIFVITKKVIRKNDNHVTFPHLTKITETVYFDKERN